MIYMNSVVPQLWNTVLFENHVEGISPAHTTQKTVRLPRKKELYILLTLSQTLYKYAILQSKAIL